LKAVSFKRN